MRYQAALGAGIVVGWTLLAACAPEAPEEEAGEVTLVTGEPSSATFPGARVEIVRPDSAALVSGDSVAVELTVENFALGDTTPGVGRRGIAISDQGQHVHLILDERPYEAVYDVTEPVVFRDLEPGAHLLVAFPSRQWHESVKETGASDMTWFFVGDTAGVAPFDPDGPLLTYSRPKGEYEGADADSVMVDFYLANATLGRGEGEYVVRLTVDGSQTFEIDRWAPHYIVGLSEGEHAFRLDLLDAALEPVGGEFASTERIITIVRPGESGEEGPGESGEEGGRP